MFGFSRTASGDSGTPAARREAEGERMSALDQCHRVLDSVRDLLPPEVEQDEMMAFGLTGDADADAAGSVDEDDLDLITPGEDPAIVGAPPLSQRQSLDPSMWTQLVRQGESRTRSLSDGHRMAAAAQLRKSDEEAIAAGLHGLGLGEELDENDDEEEDDGDEEDEGEAGDYDDNDDEEQEEEEDMDEDVLDSTIDTEDHARLTLLGRDELAQLGLLCAVADAKDVDKDDGDDGDGGGGRSPAEGDGEKHCEGGAQNASAGADGGPDSGFVRIAISEEEYWGLLEQAWEEEVQARDEQDSLAVPSVEEESPGREQLSEREQADLMRTAGASEGERRQAPNTSEPAGGTGAGSADEGEAEADSEAAVDAGTAQLEATIMAERLRNVYDSFDLRVVHERRRTGFEATKELKVYKGMLLAGRYEVESIVGEAAFSTALRCRDLGQGSAYASGAEPAAGAEGEAAQEQHQQVCIKVIKNNKDFFDQSLDEIRLLKYLNTAGNPDENHLIRMYDYFYHKEHLFIVTELLGSNLYTACKEETPLRGTTSSERFLTLPNVREIARQCLNALTFISSLGIIHCDLKPENILIKDRSTVQIKLIDFGSSCFTTDHLSSYIQSRFYRAPEVILGLKYDQRIDIWSLGCVIAELHTGSVLFESHTAPILLAKMVGALGPFPRRMVEEGRFKQKWFVGDTIVEKRQDDGGADLIYPRRSSLHQRLGCPDDADFVACVQDMLALDPAERPSADLLLQHAWFTRDAQ